MTKSRRLGNLIITASLFVLLGLAWTERQDLFDWWRLRDYKPPAAIAELATDTTMNAPTRRMFYVYHPEIDNKSSFNTHCVNGRQEQTIVLGCYKGVDGIYILNVEDERLVGVEQVTAAHELLHAAYDRLSSAERIRVNKLINQAYKNIVDERIITTIDAYKKAGADVTNELHSILGTEVRNLPKELEDYYKRYFDNRGKIVSYSERYQAVFTEQRQKIQSLAVQIDAMEKELLAQKSDLDNRQKAIVAEENHLDLLLSEGNIADYNAAVPGYNSRVNQFNADIKTFNAKVQAYKNLIDQYNSIAELQRELNRAIDSRVSTEIGR